MNIKEVATKIALPTEIIVLYDVSNPLQMPVIAITGKVARPDLSGRLYNMTKVFPINRDDTISREYSISHAPELLQNTAVELGKALFNGIL